jgi:hypothetical protein
MAMTVRKMKRDVTAVGGAVPCAVSYRGSCTGDSFVWRWCLARQAFAHTVCTTESSAFVAAFLVAQPAGHNGTTDGSGECLIGRVSLLVRLFNVITSDPLLSATQVHDVSALTS